MKHKLSFKSKYFLYFLWIGAVLVNIKSIFTDFGIDNSYAITTSYRHISGDSMFQEMWEPHQTSAFLVDALMLIYRVFVPSLTGVAIYLQIMGVFLWIPIIIILYKELSRHIDKKISHFISILLFVFRAKQTVFPEFSNMQIGFSILFFVFLIRYLREQGKLKYLIVSAVFMCLEIISYPTCIIAYVMAVGLLLMYARRKRRSLFVFSGVCFALGFLYVSYFILARGMTEFRDVLLLLMKADASHTGASMPLIQYLRVFIEGTVYMAVILAISAAIYMLVHRIKNVSFLEILGGIMLFVSGIVLLFLMIRGGSGYEWHYCIVFVLLILFGILGYRFLTEIEKRIWVCGMAISFSSFFAVAVLTNCALMSVVAYLPLAAAVSMIPLSKFRKGSFFAGTVLMFVLLHRGLFMWGYSQLNYKAYVNEMESIIRTGLAIGIVCDDITSCIYRDNVTDFERFIEENDSVFFLKDGGFDSLFYVQAGTEVSTSSTISSPTYSEYQIEYWMRYPYKIPTVIAIACYDDKITVDQNECMVILEWVEERYDWIGDGTWWRFYRIKE